MSQSIFLRVLVFSLLAMVAGLYLSSIKTTQPSRVGYPWQVEKLASGHTRVFGLTMGQSSLADAEQLFRENAEITLFVPASKQKEQGEKPVIEAFFAELKLGGLKSRMVMTMDIDPSLMDTLYNRGTRIATLGSGSRKVTLSDEDASIVRQSVISAITYLPAINLQPQVIEKRFGEPVARLEDSSSDAVHWLYPDIGLDIAVSESSKEVFQYVQPGKFDALIQPLDQADFVSE